MPERLALLSPQERFKLTRVHAPVRSRLAGDRLNVSRIQWRY